MNEDYYPKFTKKVTLDEIIRDVKKNFIFKTLSEINSIDNGKDIYDYIISSNIITRIKIYKPKSTIWAFFQSDTDKDDKLLITILEDLQKIQMNTNNYTYIQLKQKITGLSLIPQTHCASTHATSARTASAHTASARTASAHAASAHAHAASASQTNVFDRLIYEKTGELNNEGIYNEIEKFYKKQILQVVKQYQNTDVDFQQNICLFLNNILTDKPSPVKIGNFYLIKINELIEFLKDPKNKTISNKEIKIYNLELISTVIKKIYPSQCNRTGGTGVKQPLGIPSLELIPLGTSISIPQDAILTLAPPVPTFEPRMPIARPQEQTAANRQTVAQTPIAFTTDGKARTTGFTKGGGKIKLYHLKI
jgi:hypothetical protein